MPRIEHNVFTPTVALAYIASVIVLACLVGVVWKLRERNADRRRRQSQASHWLRSGGK